ncbi:hypothetical protein [Pseudomonas sp. 22 E 5]|uniref:hypothetical protein n=1 Tax=unclassified Pseudomonas TaxID=196821 RepID=UPI000812B730|nr:MULTISPECIES: hypothetical protein [unclassified Pseudomonas]MCX9151708.1 hypothetical protein [Pseudomonas sp. TB1-B1]CRM87997.1 hypothetical protein [Pseudomonas sp. 22 E 5]
MAQGYINDRTADYQSLKSRLMASGLSRERSDHFDVLNHHLRRGLVMPGQLVIIPDAYSASCSMEEAWLVRQAQAIRRELDNAGGTQVVNDYDLLQSLLGYSSLGIGSATSAWSRHLDEVAHTLEEIERLHQRLREGGLDREAFFHQRKVLFGLLETQLQGAARFGTGLRGNQALKKVLGISTKSSFNPRALNRGFFSHLYNPGMRGGSNQSGVGALCRVPKARRVGKLFQRKFVGAGAKAILGQTSKNRQIYAHGPDDRFPINAQALCETGLCHRVGAGGHPEIA